MSVTRRRTRRTVSSCDYCERAPATRVETLTYHDCTVRLNLCAHHDTDLHRQIGFYLSRSRCCNTGPIATRETISFQGHDIVVALCDAHAEQLDAVIAMWSAIGHEVIDEMTELSRRREALRRVSQRRAKQVEVPNSKTQKQKKVDAESCRLQRIADQWVFTDHANLRIEDRGRRYNFTRDDVLRALDRGAFYPEVNAPRLGRYVREKVSVLVDPTQHIVITVMPASSAWGDELVHDKPAG